jgi:predicted AlkP superfamily phosphohydrolase/phosphomutase
VEGRSRRKEGLALIVSERIYAIVLINIGDPMKTIVIGLDAATWDLIGPWIEGGKLPFFKEAVERGCPATNRTTVPPISVPAIPAFFTGKNPGKLGLFSFENREGKIVDSTDIREKAVWDYLGEGGSRCAVINLTATYPASKLNGIMITGHMIPGPDEKSTYPPELRKELGEFPIGESWMDNVKWRDPERGLEREIEVTGIRFDVSRKLIKEGGYDFTILWVFGTDRLNHFYNHRKDILMRYYKFIDSKLGEWSEAFSDHNFIIISDHGSEASPTKKFNVNSWLIKEGYLRIRGNVLPKRVISGVVAAGMNVTPQRLKSYLVRNLRKRGENKHTGELVPGIDWSSSLAYKDGLGIRLTIEPGTRDYEELREEIISRLLRVEDNGKGVVREAWKREDVYSGPHTKEMPDIIFLTDGDYRSTTGISGSLFSKAKRKRENSVILTGGHNSARNGIFLAYGPDFRSHKRAEISILDIAPTILHMHGLPVPDDMDGRVLKEIFRPGSQPATTEEGVSNKPGRIEKAKTRESDEEEIRKRLKSLGYLD